MDDIRRILVVSRMTSYCRKAVHYGISLAKKYGAELYFIHCTHDPFVFEWPPSVPVWVLAEDYKKLLIKNKEDIETVINVEKEKGMKITELIKDVDPVEVILKAVKAEHIDLIIMAARGAFIATAAGAFHDMMSGNNSGYNAEPGWDPGSGWGSLDGGAILQALQKSITAGG